MYTDEQLDQLEKEELEIIAEEIALMVLILSLTNKTLEKELRDFYSKYGTDGVVTYQEARKWVSEKDHRRRLNVLLLFISDEFDKLFNDLTPRFKELLRKVAEKEFDFFGVEFPDEFNPLAWGADDKDWEERLEEDIQLWKYKTQSTVRQSVLKQATVDTVMEDVHDLFNYMERVLNRLGLTEATAFEAMSMQYMFKQMGVSKYRFYAQEDEKTCEVCGSMHGLEFPISAYLVGTTASPMHPSCRCRTVPIVE